MVSCVKINKKMKEIEDATDDKTFGNQAG